MRLIAEAGIVTHGQAHTAREQSASAAYAKQRPQAARPLRASSIGGATLASPRDSWSPPFSRLPVRSRDAPHEAFAHSEPKGRSSLGVTNAELYFVPHEQ